MDKIINIDEKKVGFRASALTPRFYRHIIGRDIMQDMIALQNAFRKASNLTETATEEEKQEAQMSAADLEIFENVAYIMARQYDSEIPNTPDEWLDTFNMFSIYEVMPHVLELWAINNATTSKAKNA